MGEVKKRVSHLRGLEMSLSALKMFAPYSGSTANSPGGRGNGAANRVAVWESGTDITSYANFTLDLATGYLSTPGPVCIGGPAVASSALKIDNTTAISGADQAFVYVDCIISSSCTNGAYGISQNLQTAAGAFTTPYILNFAAGGIGKGAGSTITRTVNYFGSDQTVGTNNAWASDNVSFTGDWLFNFTSTRASSIAGQVRVASLGVGNRAAATTPGSVTGKFEVFDMSGGSLGFAALYDAIT